MKRLALPLALLLIAPSADASRAYNLAGQPEAFVDDQGVCHITGALWRGGTGSHFMSGPIRNERMLLRQIGTDLAFEVLTDNEGIYRIAIPVVGRTVFQETEIGRRGWSGSKPKAYCIRASVEVGDIVPVEK